MSDRWRIVSARPSFSFENVVLLQLESPIFGKADAQIDSAPRGTVVLGARGVAIDLVQARDVAATASCLGWLLTELAKDAAADLQEAAQ